MDSEEMTSLEKMDAPDDVELINDLRQLKLEKVKCTSELESQKIILELQKEIQSLKSDLQHSEKIKEDNEKKLQCEIMKYQNINKDLQSEIESLTQSSQSREKELLSSLKEARESLKKFHARPSLVPHFNTDNVTSPTNTDTDNVLVEILSLKSEIESLTSNMNILNNNLSVSEAETSLRNNILIATEHHHNNLHNTFTNTLSFLKEQLLELQNYLQNPSTAQRDIIDVYCNIGTPGLELVDTPTRIVETKTSSIPIKLFDVQASDLEKDNQETFTYLQDSNLREENLQFLSKLNSLEYLQLQYNDLLAERDDLFTQLMNNLEDLNNFKVKCAALENKIELCTCMNDKKSNDSSSQTNEYSDDENIMISKCKEYLVIKLLELKDVDTANKDLFDLLSNYNTEVDNHSKLLLNNIKSLEEQLSQKHNEYYFSQQQIDAERSQTKSQINLLEQKLEKLEREKNNLVKLADDNINILKSEIDKLVIEKTHAIESNNEIEIEYENELKIFNEKIYELKSTLNKKDAMFQTLKEELNVLEEFKDKLQLELLDKLDTENQFLDTIKTLAEKNKSLENTCAKLREQELTLISSLNELKTTHSNESATKQFEIISLKEKCIELEVIICNKEKLFNNLYTQQDENQMELNNTKEKLRNCITEKITIEEEKKSLSGQCNQLQNLISEKELLIVNLSTQIEKVNERFEIMEKELESYKTQLQDLDEVKSSLQADKVMLMNEYNEIKTLISNKELFISNMSSQIEEENKQLNAAREEIHEYISDKKILEEEKLSLISSNEGLMQILNEKDIEIQEKQSEIQLLKSYHGSTASLRFENEKIKHEIIKKDECIRSLDKQLSGGKTAKSKTFDLQSELKLNTKSWDLHLHLKRQRLHDTHRNLSSSNEENPEMMNIFIDKSTYNHLKEKYEKLVEMNEELRIKHKEQATELKRLQHSLQENTIQKLLPHDQEEKNISELEDEVSELKYQLKSKQNEYEELEDKYKEMDDTCAKLYQSYNQLSSDNLLQEAELENLRDEMRSRKEAPGKETRKKRQSLHDSRRGLVVTHTDVDTSPNRDIAHVKPCTDCGNNQLKLEELKLQNKCLLMKPSTQVLVPVVVPSILPITPLVGSSMVQNQYLSNYTAENENLKMIVAEYEKYIIKLESSLK